MKKTIAIVLALVMCLSLCACSKTASVEKALQGEWAPENNNGGFYVFDDGRFSCETVIAGLSLGAKEGSYEVTETVIKLSYDNGVEGELSYTYESGDLVLEGLIKR